MASLTPIDKKMLYYFRNESIGGAPERRRECIFDVSAHIRVDLCPSPGWMAATNLYLCSEIFRYKDIKGSDLVHLDKEKLIVSVYIRTLTHKKN
jgi:hypothetical protein